MPDRIADTERFYELMDRLEHRVGGPHLLMDFSSVVSPGDKGVYFVFENGEFRAGSDALRVVRVGTHGLTARSRSTIWTRLFEHLMFNGRSVFRDHVNAALLNRAGLIRKDLGHRHSACITERIGNMPFLWVRVDGVDGHIARSKIEKNAIALLSDFHGQAAYKQSTEWLGKHRCDPGDPKPNHKTLAKSGLWNVNFVKCKNYCRLFLDDLEAGIRQTSSLQRIAQERTNLPKQLGEARFS